MREGDIIEIQEADDLYRNPKNNYTKKIDRCSFIIHFKKNDFN